MTLKHSVAESGPGVYLAKAKFGNKSTLSDDEEAGPEIPVASISSLTRLGTTGDFITMANESKTRISKKKYDLLKEMLRDTSDELPGVD